MDDNMAADRRTPNGGRYIGGVLEAVHCSTPDDPERFLALNRDNASKVKSFSIKEFLQCLPENDHTALWQSLLSLCLSTIDQISLDDNERILIGGPTVNESNVLLLLDGIASWVQTHIASSAENKPPITDSLIQIAQTLHDVMLSFIDFSPKLTNAISMICEAWWINHLPDRELLVTNMILYVMARTLYDTAKVADVKRVWSVRGCLLLLDFEDQTADSIKEMLLRTVINPLFLKSDEGVKFISYLFGLHPSFVTSLHSTIKSQLSRAPKWLVEVYGRIYFRAWKLSGGAYLQQIEAHCIQDLMYHCVHASRGKPSFAFQTLKQLLSQFHQQTAQRAVQEMLYRLYKPFLWRSLRVANATVRANAITLMLDIFPLYDPDMSKEEIDQEIQRQFDIMKELLKDPSIIVRTSCVIGICQVLSCYWEMIPAHVIKDILTLLISDLAFDAVSSAVRTAVLQGLSILLEQRLSHPLLKELLPLLSGHLHDVSERVRLALLDLLILVKNIKFIKYWSICSLDQLLARIEEDSHSVVKRIVNLLLDTIKPNTVSSSTDGLSRTIVLIQSNSFSARRFYYHALSHMTTKDIERCGLGVCHCIANKINERAHLEDTLEGVADEREVLTGLLEILVIIWHGLRARGKHREDKLVSKVGGIFPQLAQYFQNTRGRHALYLISSFLPHSSATPLSIGAVDILAASIGADYQPLLLALVNWGQGSSIVELVQRGLVSGLLSNGEKENTAATAVSNSCWSNGLVLTSGVTPSPLLTLEILNYLLVHPVLYDRVKDLSGFWNLIPTLSYTFDIITHLLSGEVASLHLTSQQFLARSISSYHRLITHHMIEQSQQLPNPQKQLRDMLFWCETTVLPIMRTGERRSIRKRKSSNQSEPDKVNFSNFIHLIIEALLTDILDLLICGLMDNDQLEIVAEFAGKVVEKAGVSAIVQFSSLLAGILYQLIEIESCCYEIDGIVSPSSLQHSSQLMEKILTELTDTSIDTKVWSVLKPVINKALIVSQYHSSLAITPPSALPILTALAKVTLTTVAAPTQQQDGRSLTISSLLVNLCCKNKTCGSLYLKHLEYTIEEEAAITTPHDLLLTALHITSTLTDRTELVRELLHLVQTCVNILTSCSTAAANTEYSDTVKRIQQLAASIQQSLLVAS